MSNFVVDRIGFLESGEYRFEEYVSAEEQARGWLRVHNDWRWYIEETDAQDKLAELLNQLGNPLPYERKEAVLPVLGPEDRALLIWRDPSSVPSRVTPKRAPNRVSGWRFGELRKRPTA